MAEITIPGMFLTGDHASRPAATAVGGGSIYSCTTHALLYQSDGATWSTYATLGTGDATAHIADATAAHAASAVGFTPAGTIAATDVQAAIVEVAAEAGGSAIAGNVLIAAPHGLDFTQTGGGGTAGTAYMLPISIPGPMRLRKLRLKVQSGAAGSVQWGLFDYSSNAASCTKLAGGSGAVATNWADIAATSAPVVLTAGNRILIVHLPAATAPTLTTCAVGTSANVMKSQASYSWDDTPDVTSGWTDTAASFVLMLEGDIDGSTQW